MSSFVTEVLASSGKLVKEDLANKICKISRKVEDTKEEVCDMMNKKYNEFHPSLQASEDLMLQVDSVSREIEALKNCIEAEVCVNQFVNNMLKLQQSNSFGGLFGFSAMEDFNKALQEKKYVDAAHHLKRAKSSVDSLTDSQTSQLSLIGTLSSELTVQRENLIFHLGDEWKRQVIWKLSPSKGNLLRKRFFLLSYLIFTAELMLSGASSKDGEPKPPASLLEYLSFLCFEKCSYEVNKGFLWMVSCFSGQVLLKNMLKPLVMHASLLVRVSERQGEGTVLALQCLEESHEEKILCVNISLDEPEIQSFSVSDVSIGDKKLAAILGELIWEEISQCIIHECLVYSIPTNSSELEKYNAVIKETEEFEKALKQMEYLQHDSTDLLKYARDVNCHFASKKCRDVIVAARKLMTSKMHNTVKITPDSKPCLPKLPAPMPEVKQEDVKPEVTMENSKQLSVWRLPACRISESVQQLMELAINTLVEAVGSSTQTAFQLFFTVRNIFQLFYDVVPTYHKENLLKFPHLAAIQHNNCMYLAHHLLTLGHHFRAHLPKPLSEGVATFVDMVPGFRKLGAQCFLAQVNVQRAELLERLSTAHNFRNLDDEDNYIAASKAVRQVIHQLKQLGTVWQDVLPVTIYCKTMGNLLNTAISEIITKIMMLEDISSDEGEHLHTLCQTVIEEGPLVFIPLVEETKNKKYQEEVPLYVKKWNTFKELVIVLRANLQEIVDRWADGKGPLVMEFSSSEVKSLIRALFQNTERRAAALTKIK
uniref:Centromere/kinetochore protein zw10 homolog n=1 Tax=Nothobranchius furzeri TaxID=105023 RepID=A0A8C6MI50_NOTFU